MVTHGFIIAPPAAPLHMLNILINAFLHIKGHSGRNAATLYCIFIELNKFILGRMKTVPWSVSLVPVSDP